MATRPPREDELRAALLTILSTMPEGSEFRFFWRDGEQHMSLKFGAGPEQVVRLCRRPDGVGVPTPVTH